MTMFNHPSVIQQYYYQLAQQDQLSLHCYAMPLPSTVNDERLMLALTQLVQQQPDLRCSFEEVQSNVYYNVHQFVPFIEVIDTNIDSASTDLDEAFHSYFTLSRLTTYPLCQFKIIHYTDTAYLLLAFSPLVCDGLSMPTILDQLNQLYDNPLRSMALAEPLTAVLRHHYHYRQSADHRDTLNQWQHDHSDLQTPHHYMPVRYYTPSTQLKWKEVVLEEENMTLDDIYSSIILANHIIGRSSEVLVGVTTPILGEVAPSLVMPRLGILPLQIAVEATASFETLRHQLSTQVANMHHLAHINLSDLVGQTEGFPFETVIHTEETQFVGTLADQTCEVTLLKPTTTLADIDIYCQPQDKGYAIKVLYDSQQFDTLTINTYMSLIQTLCHQGVNQPERQIDEMTLQTSDSEAEVYVRLNKVQDVPLHTVTALFETQVQQHADRTALRFGDQTLTYQALDECTNQIARQLRQKGVQPNEYVAIMAERSLEMVIGILGIIKAGAAYVPIDTNYPESRIHYIIEDCQPSLMLVHEVEVDTSIPTMPIRDLMHGDATPVSDINTIEDDVYMIYTSGTTGKPKGTRIMHKSIDRLVKHADYVPLNERTVIALSGSIAFDAVTFEIYGALLNGGELVITSKEDLLQPMKLKHTIERYHINTMWLTASLFSQMVSEQVEALESLSYLLIGGEALTPKWVDILNQRPHHPQIINGYGPTESTTFTTTYAIPEQLPQRIPIGEPIPQTSVYVMQGMRRCGIGVPGELCIGGDGLAKGYLNHPEMTAERFIDNPFGPGRLYRSGDLVRLQADGQIDYLGRIDDQVKIRGFRIELSEIERVMTHINGINKAIVVVQERDGDKVLNAYYEGPQALSSRALKETLGEQLPSYMIPVHFKHIHQIPTTVNGKIDRRALPTIDMTDHQHYVAPTTEVERQLCQIFEDILHVEQVGITDNFFELGGHSLKATRVVNRIEQVLHKTLKVRDIMKSPTIQQLADIVAHQSEEGIAPIPKATPQPNHHYPVSVVQRGMYLVWQLNPNETVYNVPFIWKLSAPLDVERLYQECRQLIERHEILRTQFHMVEDRLYQVIQDDVEPDFKEISVKMTSEQDLIQQLTVPFDLENDRLMRVRYVRTQAGPYLFIDTHHSINDGMSQTLLIHELNMLYQHKTLPLATHQYKDYSEWMNAKDMTQDQAYWKALLSDDLPILDLPTDFPRPRVKSAEGDMVHFPLSETMTSHIKAYIQRHDVTDFMFFMSSVIVLLSKYSRQEDIVMGSVMSARTHPDTEKMLGMFANSLVFRGQPQANKSWLTFLNEMKTMSLSAYEHQDYPFVDLVEDLVTERDASRHPLFDVMLVRQNNEVNHAHFGHSQLTHISPMSTTAKFDLSFIIEEDANHFIFNVEYRTDLFKSSTVERMCLQLEGIMEAVMSVEDMAIAEIPTAPNAMLEWVKTYVSQDDVDYPCDATIPEMLRRSVDKAPDATALVCDNQRYTFQTVYDHASMIARDLMKQGLRKGDRVAIMMHRGHDMIEAMLGAALLGCPYVPIDPSYPSQRIDFILKDAEVKAVLTTGIEIETKYLQLNIKEILSHSTQEGIEAVYPHIDVHDVLYVIYTSGTTGQPKGVQVTHRNVMRLVESWSEMLQLQSEDVILHYENIVFDASVWSMYCALFKQVPLVIATDAERLDVDALEALMAQQNVTIASIPVQVCMLMENYHLRCLVTGGSVSTPALLERVLPHVEQYFNAYGPTETTVIATAWPYVEQEHMTTVPIGRPLPNVEAYVMANGQLCGVGAPGELCIAGDTVSKGYLKRPDLNESAFVANPFGPGKMYRTGDLVRYLENGDIAYLGRIDQQQKVNGYRIELDEITNTINRVSGVVDSAIKVDRTGDSEQLIAYYVADTEMADVLREALGNQLPHYMVPNVWRRIEALPLTPNGKLDVAQLPTQSMPERQMTAPRNEAERHFVEAFEQVLNLSPIGIDDDFFELGGTSLATMKVVTLLKDMGERCTMQMLYQHKTIRHIMAHHHVPKCNVPGNIERLNETIRHNQLPLPTIQQTDLGNVLLTGATGFLGAYLIHAMSRYAQEIYCIVRGKNENEARQRLRNNLQCYFDAPTLEQLMSKVTILEGAFDQSLDHLTQIIDTVIHAGARTDHFGEEADFYKANVESTEHLIHFAQQANAKLIYISTMSVGTSFVEGASDVTFSEKDSYKGQLLTSPYTRSKLYAEFKVLEAMYAGLDAKIMRIGNLTSSRHGHVAMKQMKTNRFSIVMHALTQLQVISQSLAKAPVSFSFVDEAAETVIQCARIQSSTVNVFHVTNPHEYTMKEVVERATGHTLNVVDDATFESAVREHHLYALDGLIETETYEQPAEVAQAYTLAVMETFNLHWSTPSTDWLKQWSQLMKDVFED